jgi:hypothetical protein
VIGLQRTAGNAAVAGLIQRRATLAEEEEPSSVRDVVGKGGGEPLDPVLRREMEVRLGGADLSAVRVHSDAKAARSALDVAATAYTVGDEIVLGADTPALDSHAGKQMLAHELTHVIQQRQGPVSGTPGPDGVSISHPSDGFEQAAVANASRAMSAQMAPAPLGEAVQRVIGTGEDEEEAEALQEEMPAEAELEEGEAEQGAELAEAGQEEVVEEAAEEEGAELEVEEDLVGQEQAELENAEEEEEEEAVV